MMAGADWLNLHFDRERERRHVTLHVAHFYREEERIHYSTFNSFILHFDREREVEKEGRE